MKKLIFGLLICLLANMPVLAEETVTVNHVYDRETNTVAVNGTVANAEDNDTVSLMLLKPGYTAQNIDDGTAGFFAAVVQADETTVQNGSFTFETVKINPELAVGDYTLRVAAGQEVRERVISVATASQAQGLIKNAASGNEVKNLVTKYNDVYELDMGENSLFSKLSATSQEAVFEKMAADAPETKAEIQNSYSLHTVLCKITEGPWTALEDVIKANEAILGVTASDINKAYSATDVYKNLTGKSYGSATEFQTALKNAIDASKAPVSSGTGGSGGGGSVSSSKGGGAVAYIPQTSAKNDALKKEVFEDIAAHAWAKESIEVLYAAGIVNGKSEGRFAPDDYVTRAEAAKMIALTFGFYSETAAADFTDISENEWAYRYIASAAENGIVNGYADGSFGKNDRITRQDIATMIYRAAIKFKAGMLGEGEISFADAGDISEYAKPATAALSKSGIINGIGGNFMPFENATRAQVAKMLAAFME